MFIISLNRITMFFVCIIMSQTQQLKNSWWKSNEGSSTRTKKIMLSVFCGFWEVKKKIAEAWREKLNGFYNLLCFFHLRRVQIDVQSVFRLPTLSQLNQTFKINFLLLLRIQTVEKRASCVSTIRAVCCVDSSLVSLNENLHAWWSQFCFFFLIILLF